MKFLDDGLSKPPPDSSPTIIFTSFFSLVKFFFPSITTKYIEYLTTKILKIKLIKQDNPGQTKKKNKKQTNKNKTKEKRKQDKNYMLPPPSLFILSGVSINHIIHRMSFL